MKFSPSYILKEDNNELFYYKTINTALCYGVIPIYIDQDGVFHTIFVKGKRKLSFPKGKKENNEMPLQCAIRETREETSLELGKHYTFIRTNKMYYDFLKNNSISTQYFPVKVFDKYTDLQSEDGDEIHSVKWYSEHEIEQLGEDLICNRRKYIFLEYIKEYKSLYAV